MFSAFLLPLFYLRGSGLFYQSIIGSLMWLFFYVMTDTFVDSFTFDRNLTAFDSAVLIYKSSIQSLALTCTGFLLVLCPFGSILRITSMGTTRMWRFARTIIYSIFFLFYFWAVMGIIIYGPPPFDTGNFFSGLRNLSWWQANIEPSSIFSFSRFHAFSIVYLGIFYVILKILFSKILYKIFFWAMTALSIAKTNPNLSLKGFGLHTKTQDEVIYHDDIRESEQEDY